MSTPVPPDPADRSSVHRATDRTHIRPPNPDSPTHSSHPSPDAEPPTVLSSQKATPRFDPNIADGLVGRKLGPFELIEGVGAGGMAAVLRARDADLGRVVALKILPPDMAADPENVTRFKQEARSAALLDHENVARVYHCGEDQGLHFIAFEFVEGDNLRQVMEAHGGTIPVPDAVSIMLQIAAGLAHAAERGVVHRDIKPSNIIVTPDGRAKIVDMGLARSLDARHNGQLTQSGVTLGTFDYISPEQAIDPRSADVRSDIYSLGCTFYHALTGQVPVPEGTAAAKLDAQKNLLPPDPRTYNPAIPADLVVILGRMMAKEPDRRYQHPDPLAAHLRGLARKLGLPATLIPLTGPAEDPVPPPPRLSLAWGLTAVAVLALCVVIFSNAFRAPPPMPTWADGPGIEIATEPDDPGPAVARAPQTEPQSAATTGELVALLRAKVPHIRLTGSRYDLTKDSSADLVLRGENVSLVSDTAAEITIGFAKDVAARPKTLTLRGTGKGRAVVRGVHFNLVGQTDDADAGLVIAGFPEVRLEECTFSPARPGSGPTALLLPTKGSVAELRQCYFARGGTAIAVLGPSELKAEQCAFAMQQAVVRVTRPDDEAGETVVSFAHCTALLDTGGALVDVADEVPCVVRAGHCLFVGPGRYGPQAETTAPVVFRQKDAKSAQSAYGPATLLGIGSGNAYHNVLAYGDGAKEYTFDECSASGFPVRDIKAPISQNPLESANPFDIVRIDPKRAFLPNRLLADLRVPGDRDGVMFGTRFVGRERIYDVPLSPPGKPDRDPTVKVWDPNTTGDTPGVYATLREALVKVQPGDTLLVRFSNTQEIDEFDIDEKMNLTIKADPNYHPILVPTPAKPFSKRKQGLFKVYGGRLVLDGLQFRLPADRSPAIATLPAGGHFELRNAVVTFEDGEDLSAVVVDDPKNQMMMMGTDPRVPIPKIVVERSFLRGKGRLLAVPASRPFELDVKNTLAALDETLIDIDPATADPGMIGTGVIHLTRVTTYLSESLVSIRGADRRPDATSAGLVKTEVNATQCLFLPARGEPRESFVRTDLLDTEDQVKRYFGWTGTGNAYGYDKKRVMLDLHPAEAQVMPGKVIDGDGWLMGREDAGDPFVKVTFRTELPEAGNARKFAGVRPSDFERKWFSPPRPPEAPVGIDDEQFPRPAD
jgi:serine/threonine protein kinase